MKDECRLTRAHITEEGTHYWNFEVVGSSHVTDIKKKGQEKKKRNAD